MSVHHSLPWTIGGDTVETVWDGGYELPIPAFIDIDDSEVTAYDHPVPQATTVRLAPSRHALTDDTAQDLLEMLVGIQGIRPPEVRTSGGHAVAVPLLAPASITAHQLDWAITDRLSLVHADRRDVYFALTTAARTGTVDRPHVELTADQTWLLVRALATAHRWQFELEAAFSTAANTLRASLLTP